MVVSHLVKMLAYGLVLAIAASACLASPNWVRPCRMNDPKCTRDNIAANSRCNRNVKGYIASEYAIPSVKWDAPYFNATYIDENLIVRNHDKCEIAEFFFNVSGDSSVLGLNCYNLNFESNRTLIQHNTFQEDAYYSFAVNTTYPLLSLTLNLKHANLIDICSAYVYTDVAVMPIFHVNPNDKPTENFLSQDLSYLNIYEREMMYHRGHELARFYINSIICDFGCDQ